MNDLILTDNMFISNGHYTKPWNGLDQLSEKTIYEMCAVFDQNGYKMTDIEVLYCNKNFPDLCSKYRPHFDETSCFADWFTQPFKKKGAILNHSWLFQRKGFGDEAYKEVAKLARRHPILHKVLRIRPKWGLDFSIDWVDRDGNVFEIVHWEWDSFSFIEILHKKEDVQKLILKTDWEDVGKQLLRKKSEWHSLPFKQQSDYKCAYVGLDSERFNDVIWE